jgi:hypothetical protein
VVSYAGGSATFDTKNVGAGKTVTATGLLLAGLDASNYTVNGTAATTADVTPASLTGTITAADKVYDGTTAATLTGASLTGVLLTDDVTYAGGSATFDTKHAGAAKTVSATGFTLGGADAGNYTVNTGATTTASVTPAPLVLSALPDTKGYDGTTASALVPAATGLRAGDSVGPLAQSFDAPDAGARTLAVNGGYAISDGNGGANYLVSLLTAPGTIESAVVLPPSLLPPLADPTPPAGSLGTVAIGTTLLDLNTGQSVQLPSNEVPQAGIYLSQDAGSVLVVGESQVGAQLNMASTLLFPVVTYDPGLYVNSQTGFLYAVDEGAVLDPGVYYNRDTQTVLVVSSNDDGNVTIQSADIKEAVQTVSSGAGTRRVASVSCR